MRKTLTARAENMNREMNIEYYEELSREEMVEEMLQADQYHQTLLNDGALLKSEVERLKKENQQLLEQLASN